MEKEGFTLSPGGCLLRTQWIYDEALGVGGYVDTDVTDRAHTFLLEPTTLHPELTLADVFTLLSRNSTLQRVQQSDAIVSLLTEYGKTHTSCRVSTDSPNTIAYLELFQVWTKNSRTRQVAQPVRASFHGLGEALADDVVEDGILVWRKGARVPLSLGLTPLSALLALPLRYNASVPVCESDPQSPSHGALLETVVVDSIPLGAILEGILWELSFFGSEEEKALTKSRLDCAVADANAEFAGSNPVEIGEFDV